MTHYSNTNNPIDFPKTDMNERSRELIGHIDVNAKIRELAEQAGLIAAEPNGFDRTSLKESEIKFAELIINECVELNKQELAFNAFERTLNKYKEHFGVE